MDHLEFEDYLRNVMEDIAIVKEEYPFTVYSFIPSQLPQPIVLRVVAANKKLIDKTAADEEDFLGEYSRELKVIVPFNYKTEGCEIYGAKWLDLKRISLEDIHFFSIENDGSKKFCVGVPESFVTMKNVILENIRTAENMLTAYERFQKGKSSKLDLLAYSHGWKGRIEYDRNKRGYK